MGQISITINDRPYQVGCDDGQESHLVALGDYLDNKIRHLITSVGQIGDNRLLVMASLIIVDELFEAQKRLDQQRVKVSPVLGQDDSAEFSKTAQALQVLSRRLTSMAETLEKKTAA